MSGTLNIKPLIVILLAGILLTGSNLMRFANAQPTQTSLILAIPSPPLGTPFWSECTIEATLKDENGNPLPNMDIRFLYCGTSLIGTDKTERARAKQEKL